MALQETLTSHQAEGRRSILIIDEAHRLSPELLEEVRLLMNLETTREKFLDIIIAGQPELSEILARPQLRQFKQRVSCYCRLEALTPTEVREYVHHRLARAGLPEQTLFPDDTLQLIYQYTQGIPRLVSSLCDSSLQTGFALQTGRITGAIIREAAKDLDLTITPLRHAPVNGMDPSIEAILNSASAAAPSPIATGASVSAPAAVIAEKPAAVENRNGKHTLDLPKLPMENYATRQKSLGLLGSLISRWT